MCGIVGGYVDFPTIHKGVMALRHRGRDYEAQTKVRHNLIFGHTRLSILDLNERSHQPFYYGRTYITYNGELWNYQSLRLELQDMGYSFDTESDTEVVAAALDCWGTDALPKFKGMFAVAWCKEEGDLYLARDPFGEIPLHIAKQSPFMFASERKALIAMGAHRKSIGSLPAGHVARVSGIGIQVQSYYDIPIIPSHETSQANASRHLFDLLEDSVNERTIADVPVCTLLSGGIDSAAIAFFLKEHFGSVTAYTAVYDKNSHDLRSAREVANYLEIDLVEVPISLPTTDDLSEVIRVIEMPHKAQIEIGWACLGLAQAIQSDGFKVCYSGEGSDELWGSYGFSYHGIKSQGWHSYRKDLFMMQQRKNFERCNKIFMAHTIESRLPFLNQWLVEYAIGLPQSIVQSGKSKPKAILQEAMRGVLPDSIINRSKVAFQDGMGLKTAISNMLPNPKRFYNAEYKRLYE